MQQNLDYKDRGQVPEFLKHLKSMTEAESPQDKYNATLRVIRDGFINYQKQAMGLAKIHGIDVKDLPAAIEEGEKTLLFVCVDLIAHRGRQSLRDKAKPLAYKFGWNLDEMVEDVLINSTPM